MADSQTNSPVEGQRVPRGRQDAVDRLNEQLNFIHSSGVAFDQGNKAEAKRISAALRIIWKTGQFPQGKESSSGKLIKKERKARRQATISLATQIGFKDFLVDTSIEVPNSEGDRKLVSWGGSGPAPIFSGLSHRLVSFEEWWKIPIIKFKGRSYSRKDIVLAMCETDGGGHVDAELCDWYYNLTRQDGHGVNVLTPTGDGKTFKIEVGPSPIETIVRQIGHETLMTFDKNYAYDGSSCYGASGQIAWMQITLQPHPDADGNQAPEQILNFP